MIKLTSTEDLITSLISKALGNFSFKFVVYLTNKSRVLLEFTSDKYTFIVSKENNALRIYDNGNIYLISNIFPENFSEEIDNIIKQQAESLSKYYKLDIWLDKINEDREANVYRFFKC